MVEFQCRDHEIAEQIFQGVDYDGNGTFDVHEVIHAQIVLKMWWSSSVVIMRSPNRSSRLSTTTGTGMMMCVMVEFQ